MTDLPPLPEDLGDAEIVEVVDITADTEPAAPVERVRPYSGGPGSRREARERVLQLLYEAEAKGIAPVEVLAGLPLAPGDPYVTEVAAGVADHAAEIDDRLAAKARGWSVERMAATDRAVLRLAVYELGWRPEIPTGAVLSEAVELARAYGTDDSPRFVNGILGALAPDLRPTGE